MEKLLTIGIPSYNMEKHLPKNLPTYLEAGKSGKLEVLILNNASTDSTASIGESFAQRYPDVFQLVSRDSKGYGGAVNQAIAMAKGRYFRVVDGDDWVDAQALAHQLEALEALGDQTVDVIQTNYCRVVQSTGQELPVRFQGVDYNQVYHTFSPCRENVPCLHSTTYRTGLLRETGFFMQDGIFFVDEEYVILPFLGAKTVLYYDLDVYRYQVGDPGQSTSPGNRAKYASHREQVVQRLLDALQTAPAGEAGDYLFFRTAQAAADHLTTLYMYLPDRKEGLGKGLAWERYVKEINPQVFHAIRKKGFLLRQMNRAGLPLPTYFELKRRILGQRGRDGM